MTADSLVATIPDHEPLAFDRSELEFSIPARFRKIVDGSKHRIAISGNGRDWTFEEVDARTNQIANLILASCAPSSGCVAYLVDHSPLMLLCALGALKAGKAFLCIHPGLPVDAQRDVLRDAIPDLLLTTFFGGSSRHLFDGAVVNPEEAQNQSAAAISCAHIGPDNPAAIYYTSGSTGRPKGVVKSHRTILHRAWLCAKDDGVSPIDRQSLVTFCSFASSEADVFGALLNGAAVELYDVAARGLAGLGRWIDERQITLLHPPVALFRAYLRSVANQGGSGLHPSVRLLALAGETVLPSDLREWRARFSSGCELRHRFSSTEAGHIAVGRVMADTPLPLDVVPPTIPVADKYVSVVDASGNVLGAGQEGELVVSSEYLALGYWGRHAETADQFRLHPTHPRQRIFRTGDMGRLRDDGTIEFLGRRDSQVKVRGYRVEISKIETALIHLPHVADAAVIEDGGQLIGFVALEPRAAPDLDPVWSALKTTLPKWEIPTKIFVLDALPLTLTGKVDRQALRRLFTAGRL